MQQDLWVEKRINEHITKHIFKFYELGILGCGRNSEPFLDLTKIIHLPKNKDEIINELTENLLKFTEGYYKSSSMVPKELNGGQNLITYYYNFIEQYVDKETLNSFKTHEEFDKFVIAKFNCRNWQNLIAPRIADTWYKKSLDTCQWQSTTTPKFKVWVESLRTNIFDQIGRIIIYNSKLNTPVLMHRDYHYKIHTSHFINFQFNGATNVAYVYDEVAKQKIYIDTPCYMFNETDLHGVDPCSNSRFTVRIDGQFKSHICEFFNLNNGNVWDETSESFSKINNIKIIEPIYEK